LNKLEPVGLEDIVDLEKQTRQNNDALRRVFAFLIEDVDECGEQQEGQ